MLNWTNLTKEERHEYMTYQMSPSIGYNSGGLPDDCCECPVCGQPTIGSSWCQSCFNRFEKLNNKLNTKYAKYAKYAEINNN